MMDAAPLLARVAALLERHHLEALLIGNAAGALYGAPVVTIDIDFVFRKTATNVLKLHAVAEDLRASFSEPRRGAGVYQIVRHEDKLPIVFMTSIAGTPSFALLRRRAIRVELGGEASVLVASMADVMKSRKAIEALRDQSGLGLRDQIRRLLALPPERRTHFLRKRVGIRMSCL